MQTYVAYACFTNTAIVVSYNVANIDDNTVLAVMNALNTNSAEIDDSLMRQYLSNRRSSYRFCEGIDWQSLSGVGKTKEAALKELKKNMNEWLPSWVENYLDVGKQVVEYIDEHEPSVYTDITDEINMVHLNS